jgi:hypothetical protein
VLQVGKDEIGKAKDLIGSHQLLVYADDINLLGDKIDTVKKNTETLIDPRKEILKKSL